MQVYLDYWLTRGAFEKRRKLEEAWRLSKAALGAFRRGRDGMQYGITFNLLGPVAGLGFSLEGAWKSRERVLTEAIECGEDAIAFLTDLERPEDLAKAYVLTANFIEAFNFYFHDVESWEKYSHRAPEYWLKAKELSEETAFLELSNPISHPLTDILGWGHGTGEAITKFKRVLESCEKTKDKFLLGTALAALSFHTWWESAGTEDPSEVERLRKAVAGYDAELAGKYSSIAFTSPQPLYPECFWQDALEPDVSKLGIRLTAVVEAESRDLKKVRSSLDPEAISGANCRLSQTLMSLARVKTSPREKERILEEALFHANEALRIKKQISPPMHWSQAVSRNVLADIKRELAEQTGPGENRKRMLEEAIRDKETSLKLGNKFLLWMVRTWGAGIGSDFSFNILGRWQYERGELLRLLYELTLDGEHLKKASRVFLEAGETYQRLGLAGRSAECYWRVAQTYDVLGEYQKAAENFESAASYYATAAEKIASLSTFFFDQASHMRALSLAEKAKYHHSREEYGSAERYYEEAAAILRASKQWSFLSLNYLAWGQTEDAEKLSKMEKIEDAVHSFGAAADSISEGIRATQLELGSIDDPGEKQTILTLLKTAVLHEKYCKARVVLEKARKLDRSGEHLSSSEKFGEAAEMLEPLVREVKSTQMAQELEFIMTISKAWGAMTRAEAESSPKFYAEAARLFERSKQFATSEKSKMLSLGHGRLCKALEAGTRFAETGDAPLYVTATQHLENAANFYAKAGVKTASEHVEATRFLLDACLSLNNARKESDSVRKAELFARIGKLLQTSADLYQKAQHQVKSEEVRGILHRVGKELESITSLSGALGTPPMTSVIAPFAVNTPAFDKPLGPERFEHADVQTRIVTGQTNLGIGDDLNLDIELVNAGRGPAQLLILEGIVPEGFELKNGPETLGIENNNLNMRGKRLYPLKEQEVKLLLRPLTLGRFKLSPRILYLDESGQQKWHQSKAVEVTVEEARRLAAIMFTDIVGYTAMAQANESRALDLLKRQREILRPIIVKHGGSEVKTMGDAFLVEFSSALAATECAADMEGTIVQHNKDRNENLQVRIGIHVGDVVHEGGDVYGDAVNVASRIEPLAQGGGVCISQQVYDQVRNKINLRFSKLEAHELKNVSAPIDVYRLELP